MLLPRVQLCSGRLKMFHVEPIDTWPRILELGDVTASATALTALETYRDWLKSEAIPAGGLGPGEISRIDDRHIGDSLLFSGLIPETSTILDIGSGVGLPGIPLAIVRPDTDFVLLDRSRKRVDLMKRAVRILNLDNVQVVQQDLESWKTTVPVVVSRATVPPDRFLPILREVVAGGGLAILGGSWEKQPNYSGYETKEIGSSVFDRPVWLLMMRQT